MGDGTLGHRCSPGEIHYARECGDNDLLGRAICHFAYVHHENRPYKRAASRMAEYVYYYRLYKEARALEG
jgi:hypothetical protein